MSSASIKAAELLAEVGCALYGRDFTLALSQALGVSDRTVRRWLAGEHEPQPGVWRDCLELLRERSGEFLRIAEQIGRFSENSC